MVLVESKFVGYNGSGKRVIQSVIISDDTPATLPTDGSTVTGMSADDVFAPGSLMIIVNDDAVYLAGEDGTFVLQE